VENERKNSINWFPGHMTKSLRMIDEEIKLVDVIVYVLDSRAVKSCLTPEFEKRIANKKTIYVLNKIDLSDEKATKEWVKYFQNTNSDALAVNSTSSKSGAMIFDIAKKLCKERLDNFKSKGVKRQLRAMILGVPNSGKSTLTNNLAGSAKTTVGNRPGVTRGKQWVKVNDYFEVLDTPGTLYPKIEDIKIAHRLAFIGSIKDEILDRVDLAFYLVNELNALDKNILKIRFNIDNGLDGEETLNSIAKSRGYILKGSVPDITRASQALIDDFRKGRLGRISLERVDDN